MVNLIFYFIRSLCFKNERNSFLKEETLNSNGLNLAVSASSLLGIPDKQAHENVSAWLFDSIGHILWD